MLLCFIAASVAGVRAQATYLANETFSASLPQGWSVYPVSTQSAPTWSPDGKGIATSGSYSMHGHVPYNAGDTVEMVTPYYDCSNFRHVMLRFNQICKVLPSDLCQIMFQENYMGSKWKPIPYDAYEGGAVSYKANRSFDHSSYSDWLPADTFAAATNSWWKEEVFDLSDYASYSIVRFKFVIKKGTCWTSFIADGWYIDDFQVMGSNFLLKMPVVSISTIFGDTVFNTGPYVIRAKVATRSEAPIVHPYLHYTAIRDSVKVTDSISMTDEDGGDSLWTATIPQYVFGTTISYYIEGRDSVGNTARDAGGFTSKYVPPGGNYILTGDSTLYGSTTTGIQNCSFPFMLAGAAPSWVRMLYMADMVKKDKSGGLIGSISFYDASYNVVNSHDNVKIYLKATTATSLTALGTSTIDPIADGATLVYKGKVTGQLGWNQIYFDKGFLLPAGMNLMWYVVDDDPNNACNSSILYWCRNQNVGYNSVDRMGQFSCSGNSSGTTTDLPTTIFYFGVSKGDGVDSNSVTMYSIDNPQEGTIAGTQTVKVTIKNYGISNLTSAKLGWSVNGVVQTPVTWTGNLPCDFNDTVTLGKYTQKLNGYDTIVCWVNTPNGIYDSITSDDTLTVIAYGCSQMLSGVYTVGKGAGYDFQNMAEALFNLSHCGISSNVELKLASGIDTTALDFRNFGDVMGHYRLTISSIANNADSVIFCPNEGDVITLGKSKNLIFKNLTFTADSAAERVIYFASACENISFIHCHLKGFEISNTSNTHAVVYASTSGLDNIRFTGNYIEGGDYGIYIYGSGYNSNTNILFDSNYVENSYYYPFYTYYTDIDFLHNEFVEVPGYSYYYGPTFYYARNSRIEGNHIRTKGYAQYTYGMRLYYTDSTVICSNNEMIIAGSTTLYGLYDYYTYGTPVVNNSIYLYGAASTKYGIYAYTGSNAYSGTIYNNNVVIDPNAGGTLYPLYLSSNTYITNWDIDYNNWYSKTNIAYVGSAITTLQAYQAAVKTAVHETNVMPIFKDTNDLHVRSYVDLKCPAFPGVTVDKDGKTRYGTTGRGCYTTSPDTTNLSMIAILDWPYVGTAIGDTLKPRVVVQNTGLTTITSATFGWDVSGVSQASVKWTGSLPTSGIDTIALGNYICVYGYNDITVYLNSLGGGLNDANHDDDTITATNYTCSSSMSGTYTIGDTGYFASMEEAVRVLELCGMGGPVTLAFQPGTYYMNVTIGNITGMSATNTLKITSITGDSSDVVLQRADDASTNLAPIMINGGSYIEICNVTLCGYSPTSSSYSYSRGVMVMGNSEHINIHNCWIYVPKNFSSAVTGTNQNPVYLYGADVRDVEVHHNLVEGGACGFYVYGSGTASRIADINIHHNVVGYIDYYTAYMYYADSVTFKNNEVHQRRGNFTVGNMYSMYAYYTNANIENNVFDLENIYAGYYIGYFGDTTNGFNRIVNNELRSEFKSGNTGYGVYFVGTTAVKMLHNSFYLKNVYTSNYGLYLSTSTMYASEIKNNIFHLYGKSVNCYPMYIGSASYITNRVDVEGNCCYNEYPTKPYVGYSGAAFTDIATWRNNVDKKGVFARPDYVDVNTSLMLMDSMGVSCDYLADAPTDIMGRQRDTNANVMGAYAVEFNNNDLAMKAVISPVGATTTGQNEPLKVVIMNVGTNNITSASISYKLNDNNGPVYNWTGSLAPYAMDTVVLGNVLPKTGINMLSAYCFAPNGANDPFKLNDTVTVEFVGCDSAMTGTYTVGTAQSDFATMEDALFILNSCGVGGPVEILVADGTYDGITISGEIPGSSDTNVVTFRSASNNRTKVIFDDLAGIKLENTANLFFEEITFEGVVGVELAGSLKNIEFHHCNILSEIQTNSTYRAVNYYGTSGGNQVVEDVRFIGNTISGGYYNMYLYYLNGNQGNVSKIKGLVIDSNSFQNAYYYCMYLYYYGAYESISHNTIKNGSNATSAFYGMYAYYDHLGRVDGNRIILNNSSTSYGMYAYYPQPGRDNMLTVVCNNEVILKNSSTQYGIEWMYPQCLSSVSNNSVYTNTTSTAYGLYLYSTSTAYPTRVYNNMLINGKNTGYPLYISSTTYCAPTYTIMDYNNYVSAGANLAYMGAAKTTLAAIKSVNTSNNIHSTNTTPTWVNLNTSMQIANQTAFRCPAVEEVEEDIIGLPRLGNTGVGCYGLEPDSNDAMLCSFIGVENLTSAASSPIHVVIRNTGYNAIDSARITFEIDGVRQNAFTYIPTRPLAFLKYDTLFLGSYQLADGDHTFKAWVDMLKDTTKVNDTVNFKRMVCGATMEGIYVIGPSQNADYTFADLNKLFNAMVNCGVSDDITLKFESGSYTGAIDLSSIATAMGDHHLTLTSLSGNRRDVTIATTTTVLHIGGANKNITVRDLTLQNTSTTSSTYVVYMDNGCSNIDILYNNLLRDTTSTTSSTYVIYNPSSGTISKINIRGNLIRGGYYGIYLYGSGSSSVNDNVNVDSNDIVSQYYYACYMYYNGGGSISHNRILSRRTNGNTYWYGMYNYYGQYDSIVGNEIDATRYSSLNYPYAMYLYYLNYYGSKGNALVANNTVKAKTTSSYYASYAYMCLMDFVHNTIHMEGTGAGYGMYYYGYSPYSANIKGNIFDVSSSQWAFYNNYTTNATGPTMDYNNYYNHGGANLVRMLGNGYSSLAALRAATGMDANSVSTAVTYETGSLVPKSNSALVAPAFAATDKEWNARRTTTSTMGAYQVDLSRTDAALINFASTKFTSGSTPVKVTLFNMGIDTIKSATINWTFNGVSQTPVNWTGVLATGESDVVALGNVLPVPVKVNNLVAWVSNPNGGQDLDNGNDTTDYEEYICNGRIAAGTYTVGGANADFADPKEMQMALYTCGVAGPVTFKIRTGNYATLNMDGGIKGASRNSRITIMADSAANVVFDGGNGGTGMIFKNLSYVTFKGLTFGNTTNGTIGVEMGGACTDVTIRECNIYACTTATNNAYRAFSYPNTSGSSYYPVEVRIVANNIAGGYYNMYLYYPSGSTSYMMSSSMYIDSNVLTDAYYYGIYSYYYSHYPSISYNTISSRYAAASGNSSIYYGLYTYYYTTYGKVEGNKFYIISTSTSYGMYMYYYHNYPSYSNSTFGLVANNEVRIMGANGAKYGIYVYGYYSNLNIMHNSVYCISENSTAYGMYLTPGSSSGTYNTNVSRNMFICDGNTNYPMYISNTYYATGYGKRSWNNHYSMTGSNIGYAGAAKTTVAAFQTTTGQDSNLLNISPRFVKLRNSLELDDYDPFLCPATSLVTSDLNGNPRAAITAVGCYGAKMWDGVNLLVDEFVSPVAIADVICYENKTPVTITIKNMGRDAAIFDSTSLRIDLDVTGAVNLHYDTVISTGRMTPTQTRNITLATIPTQISGIYKINVKLTYNDDVLAEDDTLSMVYNASRVDLPYDIDFSTVPNEFVNVVLSGKKGWSVEQGSSNIATPVYGTGRLEFAGAGNPGAFANAVFNAVNIHGCINPKLSFWYNHVNDPSLRDLTIVLATTDGGATYKEIGRIMAYDTITGWKQHDINLNGFVNSNCLSIVFQAISFGGVDQNIDRVRITADMDAAMNLLPMELGNACENDRVPLKVTVENLSRLIMDFVSDTITAEVTGATTQSFSYVYSMQLGSYESDTLTLGYIDMRSNGDYYVNISMQSQDANTMNDTISDSTVYVYQDISLDSIVGIDGQTQKLGGDTVFVSALVRNNCNMAVDKFTVTMELNGEMIVTDTVFRHMEIGDSIIHAISMPYVVPFGTKEQPYYFLELSANIPCDAESNNDRKSMVGIITVPDTIDLQVLSIAQPTTDSGRVKVSPKVTVANIGNAEVQTVMLHVDVLDSAKTLLETVSEYINFINSNDTLEYAFSLTYTVPNYDGNYYLKAYLDTYASETNTANDTLTAKFACIRNTTGIADHAATNWSVGQNEPNPANATTVIPFVIPEDAEVALTIMGVNGQLLHREIIAATAGANRVTLQTGTLPSGLYYYGVEYKGQRIVRKMNIVR